MINNPNIIKNVTIVFLTIFLVTTNLFGQGMNSKVAEANKLFEEQKYDEANTKYRDALVDHPESDILHFNIGDVQYKKSNYEEALKSYQTALSSEDILMQSKNYYNMGNTLYKMGKLPESILHYRKALELNPEDEDAKYNLEYVRAKLKDESEKQNQAQDQNQKKEEQQDQQQKNQEEQKNQEQQENQEKQQQQEEQGNNQEEQQNQQQQNEDQQEPEEEEQQEQNGEPKDISKEDAERILDALKNEEEDLLKNKKREKVKGAFRGKDW